MKQMPDGTTRKEHLLQVQKKSGRTPKVLIGHKIPDGVEYLYNWYFEVKMACDNVDYQSIYYWAKSRNIHLKPFEVDAFIGLDMARREVLSKDG